MNWRHTALAGFLLVLVWGIFQTVAAQTTDFATPQSKSPEGEILRLVETQRNAIGRGVETGRLPTASGAAAETHYRELQKYLVRSEADINILRIDLAAEENTEARQRIIAAIARLQGEREARKLACLDRLRDLNEGVIESSGTAPLAAPAPAMPPEARKTASQKDNAAGTHWNTSEMDIVIKIAPEDITTGRRE